MLKIENRNDNTIVYLPYELIEGNITIYKNISDKTNKLGTWCYKPSLEIKDYKELRKRK